MSTRTAAKGSRRSRRCFVFIYLGLIGAAAGWVLLQHVMVKNRIVEIGARQREAECAIADLERDIRGLDHRIEESLSRQNLMDRLAAHRTRLRPIQPGAAVIIPASAKTQP